MAMKWTTYLAVEETEREKKGAKKGQKAKWNILRLAKKRDRLKTGLKLCIPERETERESLGKAMELRTAATVQE